MAWSRTHTHPDRTDRYCLVYRHHVTAPNQSLSRKRVRDKIPTCSSSGIRMSDWHVHCACVSAGTNT